MSNQTRDISLHKDDIAPLELSFCLTNTNKATLLLPLAESKLLHRFPSVCAPRGFLLYSSFFGVRWICLGGSWQPSKTPRAVLRVKNAQPRLAKPADPGPTAGLYMERSQSRISLSASFEALAIYFPCMNSFDEDDGGKWEWHTHTHRHSKIDWDTCCLSPVCWKTDVSIHTSVSQSVSVLCKSVLAQRSDSVNHLPTCASLCHCLCLLMW